MRSFRSPDFFTHAAIPFPVMLPSSAWWKLAHHHVHGLAQVKKEGEDVRGQTISVSGSGAQVARTAYDHTALVRT